MAETASDHDVSSRQRQLRKSSYTDRPYSYYPVQCAVGPRDVVATRTLLDRSKAPRD
jgi:hypothetical protein